MFEEFAKYIEDSSVAGIENEDELLKYLSERNILNGMYRVFKEDEVDKWNKIVEEAFTAYKGRIKVFGYDWLGRVFALKNEVNTVILMEPGTGEVLDIGVGLAEFHNVEIAEYHEDSLASNFFEEWFEISKHILEKNECAGYVVPLFLNGEDNVDNLEVSDMEVYWGIMSQFIN